MAAFHNMRGWILVFHLAGIVFWIGGLLILTRLLRFSASEPPSVREMLDRVETWLQYFFILPGTLVVIGTGAWLVRARGFGWVRVSLWLHIKLALTVVVIFIHLALWGSQRRVARTHPQRAVVRGGWRVQQLALWVLLVGLLTLSVLQPFVGGQ
jgi:putative membrane protein